MACTYQALSKHQAAGSTSNAFGLSKQVEDLQGQLKQLSSVKGSWTRRDSKLDGRDMNTGK